jgi:N utilization substance protein A
MSPAEVVSIVVDEERNSMDVAVTSDQLSQAIGRGGQNVRLASQLTNWELNVMDEQQAAEKSEEEAQKLQKLFMDDLDVDEEVAVILVQEGFSTVEEIAYVPNSELMQIEEFEEAIVEELRGRARDVLLTRAIVNEESMSGAQPAQDLLEMEGMDDELAYRLAGQGIVTMEDLAEQAVDDLLDIEGLEAERAGQLIMTARAPWFAEQEQG